ncbi:S1 family peptidase [Nocardiopsis alkaliphila]|uniref:S1 family peptidase n=1 Tax=Nocardiopsis alkaliphila TaxID=225762 RepID=UPI000360DF5A|nr:serine protease [Nocardiopsis alkaliphila]
MSPMEPPPWQFQVLGTSPYGEERVLGGAVLLGSGLAVTCAHVVAGALGHPREERFDPPRDRRVRLRSILGGEHEMSVSTDLWSSGPDSRDLAVLRSKAPDLAGVELPMLFDGDEPLPRAPLSVLGYPELTGSMWASAVYRGRAGPSSWSSQADIVPGSRVRITEGYSGCAVRAESGEVVGIMQQNHRYAWGVAGEPSDTAFFLPLTAMRGLRDTEDGDEVPVSIHRLIDESMCGVDTYQCLHDFLDPVSLGEVSAEEFLTRRELDRVRERLHRDTSAWSLLMALWELLPRHGEPAPALAWVHHVQRTLRHRRPVPPSVWSWIVRTAVRDLGPSWEERLGGDRRRRLESGEGRQSPMAWDGSQDARAVNRPRVVAIFHLEQVARGYRMTFGIARWTGEGYELRPQESQVVSEEAICDRISALVLAARSRGLFTVQEGPVGLRLLIPRSLVNLRLGRTPVSRGVLAYPPRLAVNYEIVYHVSERVRAADYLDADPSLWKRRSHHQSLAPQVRHRNVLMSWEVPLEEVADRLGDEHVTVCAVDSDHQDHTHVFDAILHQGVPTIVHGPQEAVRELVEELLLKEPEARVDVGSLAGYLRERSILRADTRDISLINDGYGDDLLERVLSMGEL